MYKNISVLNNDVFTIEYFLQSNICRLCWSPYADRKITSKDTESSVNDSKSELLAKICDCLSISLVLKSGPDKICQSCFDNVECFYSFKSFCKETDRRLREIFKQVHESSSSLVTLDIKTVKSEKHDNETKNPQTDVIDDFLELLYASDNCSDDNLPLKDLKEKCPVIKVKRKRKIFKRSKTYCTICRIDFVETEKLSEHNSKSHGVEHDGFKCFGCEKRFRTRRGRMGHEIQFCKSLKDGYKCSECENHLPSRGSYEKHMNKHRKNKSDALEQTMKCRKCKEIFSSLEDLKRHKELHSSAKKNFICEVCTYAFIAHATESSAIWKKRQCRMPNCHPVFYSSYMPCRTCGKVFARHDYLYKHKMTHSGSKAYVCSHCGFRTSQKSSLTVHIRKHTGERPYPCDLCPQRCISSSNLLAHRRRHLGVNKFECSICGKKFGYKMSLDEHFASTHDRSQSHVCALCGAMYSRKRGLRRHMQSKHTKDDKKIEENTQKPIDTGEKIQETAETGYFKNDEIDFFVKYKEDAFVKGPEGLECSDKNETLVA